MGAVELHEVALGVVFQSEDAARPGGGVPGLGLDRGGYPEDAIPLGEGELVGQGAFQDAGGGVDGLAAGLTQIELVDDGVELAVLAREGAALVVLHDAQVDGRGAGVDGVCAAGDRRTHEAGVGVGEVQRVDVGELGAAEAIAVPDIGAVAGPRLVHRPVRVLADVVVDDGKPAAQGGLLDGLAGLPQVAGAGIAGLGARSASFLVFFFFWAAAAEPSSGPPFAAAYSSASSKVQRSPSSPLRTRFRT